MADVVQPEQQANMTPPSQPAQVPPPVQQVAQTQPKSPKSKSILIILLCIFFLLVGLAGGFILARSMRTDAMKSAAAPIKQDQATNTPLLIGGILPLTGDASSYGIPIQQSAFLTENEINQTGGIGGRQIKFLWEDGRCDAKDAKAAADKLVNKEKVNFLFAGVCSGEFLAAAPVAQAAKIISFTSSATSPKISMLGKYVFRTAPSDSLAGKVAAQYAFNKMHAKTAGIIAENTAYAQGLHDVFKQEFTSLGGTIGLDDTYETGTTDFAKISGDVASAKLDVLYILPQTPTPGVLLITALKNSNVTVPLMTAEVLLERDALQKHGKILDGVTGIEALVDQTTPKAQHFINLYKSNYSSTLVYPAYMLGMHDALYLLKEAYEKVGNDPDAISSYIDSLKDWQGAIGSLSFNTAGDPTFSYSIEAISNSTATQIDTYTPTGTDK